jgi:hypothetical protein
MKEPSKLEGTEKVSLKVGEKKEQELLIPAPFFVS